jgi:hypothetical protein
MTLREYTSCRLDVTIAVILKILSSNLLGLVFEGSLPYTVKLNNVSLIMEAARTSETSVDIQLRTRQYIPENSELQRFRLNPLRPSGNYMNHLF